MILNLYLQHGIEKTLEKLNGTFSIVIYDLRLGKVYIARDRFGIKPMYFTSTEGSFRGLEAELFLKIFGFEVWCELFVDKRSVMEVMGMD